MIFCKRMYKLMRRRHIIFAKPNMISILSEAKNWYICNSKLGGNTNPCAGLFRYRDEESSRMVLDFLDVTISLWWAQRTDGSWFYATRLPTRRTRSESGLIILSAVISALGAIRFTDWCKQMTIMPIIIRAATGLDKAIMAMKHTKLPGR